MPLKALRLRFALLLCIGISLALSACKPPQITQQESYVFGTRVEVLVYSNDTATAHQAMAAVLQEFDRLHHSYHAWQPSQLTALNAAIAAGKTHTVSPELADLIRTAQKLAADSHYLFDPGIGQLIALWGFQRDEFKAQLPDAAALARWKKAQPSIRDLNVSTSNIVRSSNRAVALDFGGYLKGVALDHASAILKQHGINNALINIGGNIMALGQKGGQPWRVGIQHPRPQDAGGAPLATLTLHDGEAIGTSGDYQRYFEWDGQRYCHLLDPRSAAPTMQTQAVTVLITPQPVAHYPIGMLSDVASKPLFIATQDWQRLAQEMGISHAMRVAADGKIEMTSAMQKRLNAQ